MESGKTVTTMLASSLVALIWIIGCVSSKPAMEQQWSNGPQQLMPHYELHPIDGCIFACDHCFKADALVKCANECITSEAAMGIEWITTCPYLSKQYALANNPFRH